MPRTLVLVVILTALPTIAVHSQCVATGSQTPGPYYIAGSPESADLVIAGDGPLLTLQGSIVDFDCQPIPNTWIDVWHADANGVYDLSGSNWDYRGHFFADADGNFVLSTILPGIYPGRTRHIHIKLQGENTPVLTTQLYFPGEALNPSDAFWDPALEVAILSADPDGNQVASFAFVLPSTCTAPTVAVDPTPQSLPSGGLAVFSVTATGSSPLTYQWQSNGTDIPGATQDSLSISGLLPSDAGDYICVVANSCGSTTSETATLIIDDSGSGALFTRGDCNESGNLDIADGVFILNALFAGGSLGDCEDARDTNDDGALDIADAVHTLAFLFSQGAPAPPPSTGCGLDPTPDGIGCIAFGSCP